MSVEDRLAAKEMSVPGRFRPYAPQSPEMSGSPRTYPNRAIVILETLGPEQTPEFRIGFLTKKDFEAGLRRGDGVSLNRLVAERCFTGEVYLNALVAERIALGQQRSSTLEIDGGIKVIQCHDPFPGVDSRVLTLRKSR